MPDDAPYRFGLGEAVSPLRLGGHGGDAEQDQAAGSPQCRRVTRHTAACAGVLSSGSWVAAAESPDAAVLEHRQITEEPRFSNPRERRGDR